METFAGLSGTHNTAFQTTCAIQHLLLERQPYLKDHKLKISNAD